MDSKFQFGDASPPPTAWAPSFRRVSGGSLCRRNSSIGLPRPTTARVVPPRRLSIGPNPTEASKPLPIWRGTRSSNPFRSSRQSVSRGISPSCIENLAVAAACAGPARRHGRQRRAGLLNITPTAGNISVGPYSSTVVLARRFATWLPWCAKRGRVSDVTKPWVRSGSAKAKHGPLLVPDKGQT